MGGCILQRWDFDALTPDDIRQIVRIQMEILRKKLEDDPNAPTLIKTVWGTGYILEV